MKRNSILLCMLFLFPSGIISFAAVDPFNWFSEHIFDAVSLGVSLGVALVSIISFLEQRKEIALKSDVISEIKNDGPKLLQNFVRWLVPRPYRAEIDLIIRDIELDLREMEQEGRHWLLILLVKGWHTATSLYGLLCDAAYQALKRLWPSVERYSKISAVFHPPGESEDGDGNGEV